jgi:P4 family phage/plasmid primase-like protien
MLDKSILDNDLNEKVTYTDFFKAFGYEPKEQVYIRLFDDSKTDKNDMGRKMGQSADRFDGMVETLKRENSNRRGVYFVVNGGGNTDKEVLKSKCCKAQFAEMDDFSFEEQINRLNKFQYEPSIIVKTKKSLHCYWLLDNGNIKCFRPLQECFIKQFDGDPVIKNESRVMRLYGFNHCKQEPPVMVKLIKFNPEMRYSQEQLAKALPKPESKGKGKKTTNTTASTTTGGHMDKYYNVSEPGRTNALVSYVGYLKNTGINDDEIKALIRAANSTYNPPLSETELEKEVFPAVSNLQDEEPNTADPFIDGKINKAFFHQWDIYSKVPRAKRPFDSRIRDYLPKKYSVIVFSGIPWIYVNGHWIKDETTAKLRYLIELFLYEEFKTDTYIRRIYDLIIKTATLEKTWRDVNKQPKTWVNFKDCYVDLYDLTEHEHKPEYYTLNQIDIAWETVKAAGPGKITDDFLNFAIPNPDDREMLLEFFGCSLTSDNGQQKALILYGNGSTGKSTILNLERSILGFDNVSDVALQELGTRFKASRLVGMLANISADLPAASLKDSSTFKMITGNDAIDTERKGKDGFSFVNYAKMIFSTNGLPIIEGERSTGAFRRLLLISFQNTPTEKDPLLPEKLSHELPYFCQLIAYAGHRMYQRGYVLESPNSENDIKQLRNDSDVTQAWLDECTETSDRHKQTSRQDLYTSFEMYCRSENRIALKPNSFYAALRAKGFMEYRTQNQRGFYGIYANFGVRNTRQ